MKYKPQVLVYLALRSLAYDVWMKAQTAAFILSGEAGRIRALSNTHKGGRCFIIGTGPSLNETDLSLLEHETTFAVKSFIPEGMEKFGLAPTFYSFADRESLDRVIDDLLDRIPSKTVSFFPFARRRRVLSSLKHGAERIHFLNDYYGRYVHKGHFSTRADRRLFCSGSVIIDYCIPMAIYMGFTDIYLVGCDHSVPNGLLHFDGSTKTMSGRDPSTIPWTMITKAFEVVRAYADKHGVTIKNATVGGALDVFDRARLEDVLR